MTKWVCPNCTHLNRWVPRKTLKIQRCKLCEFEAPDEFFRVRGERLSGDINRQLSVLSRDPWQPIDKRSFRTSEGFWWEVYCAECEELRFGFHRLRRDEYGTFGLGCRNCFTEWKISVDQDVNQNPYLP